MEFVYRRRYQGPLRAVILDWAGTTLDFGCMAPAVVFREVYAREGVPITIDEARAPMGAHKRVHIQRIGELDSVRARWRDAHGRDQSDEDVERMFRSFIPLQLDCLADYADLIPGALDTVSDLRERGLKIGSTTGYTREMMELLRAEADRRGYRPDASVCATDVPAGRPYPHMCLKNVIELEVSPVAACVKVDDTLPGVEEGLNAGMWTIGLAVSGNEVGLPLEQWESLSETDRARKRARARLHMARVGAHYVVDTIADVLDCIDDIERRLARGERP